MAFHIDKQLYRLADGETLDLRDLDEAEALYLRWLDARAASGEGYDELLPAVLGPGSYLMGPAAEERRAGPVYRAALDLLERIAHAGDGDRTTARSVLARLFARDDDGSTQTMAVLHLVDGMTLEEVAAEVGMSVSGVRKRLRRLRADLVELEAAA